MIIGGKWFNGQTLNSQLIYCKILHMIGVDCAFDGYVSLFASCFCFRSTNILKKKISNDNLRIKTKRGVFELLREA